MGKNFAVLDIFFMGYLPLAKLKVLLGSLTDLSA
jgi:hypothetical protein